MLVSDVAVGAILAEAAFRAGRINVEINLRSMKDAEFVLRTRTTLEADGKVAESIRDGVTATAAERMGA